MNRTLEIGLFGLAGGIAGLVAKRIAGELASRVLPKGGSAPSPGRSWSLVGTKYEGKDEPSTEALARVIYTKLAGHPPTAARKKRLGTAVHWGFGATLAVTYALARRQRRGLDLGGGIAFGVLVWALIDELGISLLGLQGAPSAYPPISHVNALAQHLAYGAAVAATTQRLAHI